MTERSARQFAEELVNRRGDINRELSRNGVRFGVYKNGEYHDRLFPYDPIPRIIESDEFDELEAGLKQRVNALNAYLQRHLLRQAHHPRRRRPRRIRVHVGRLLSASQRRDSSRRHLRAHRRRGPGPRRRTGDWWVLEDNLRIPSGASYPLFARDIERRIDSQTVPRRACARQPRLSATAAQSHGLRLHRRHRRRAHAGALQFRVLRACLPGRENRRGARVPRRPRSRRQQAVLPRLCRQAAPRGRGLPPPVRRIPRPVRVQPGFGVSACPESCRAYRSGNVAIVNAPGNGAADDKADLLFRAADDPLLSRRGADSAQRADLHADVREGPQGSARPAWASWSSRTWRKPEATASCSARRSTRPRREDLADRIKEEPRRFIAQEVIQFRDIDVIDPDSGEVSPRKCDLRAFVVTGQEHARVVFRPDALLVSARPDDRQLVAGRRIQGYVGAGARRPAWSTDQAARGVGRLGEPHSAFEAALAVAGHRVEGRQPVLARAVHRARVHDTRASSSPSTTA